MKINIYISTPFLVLVIACSHSGKTHGDNSGDTMPVKDTTIVKDQPKTCTDLAMDILTSSPDYLEKTRGLYEAVVKNGGTSFGIMVEGTPDPANKDSLAYSATYDFSLYETYPDHTVTTARFSFDPAKGQLYEYDIVLDSLTPLILDKKSLQQFNERCK